MPAYEAKTDAEKEKILLQLQAMFAGTSADMLVTIHEEVMGSGSWPEDPMAKLANSVHELARQVRSSSHSTDSLNLIVTRSVETAGRSQAQVQEILDRYITDLRIAQVQARTWQDRYTALVEEQESRGWFRRKS